MHVFWEDTVNKATSGCLGARTIAVEERRRYVTIDKNQ